MASKPAHPILVQLQRGAASDRAAIMRMRAPPASRPFVHYNWFWLDRSLADPEIRFRLIRQGPRQGLAGNRYCQRTLLLCATHELGVTLRGSAEV